MLPILPDFTDYLMTEALEQARRAAASGEVPVGAVLAYNNQIIARAHNTTERDKNVASHAELHVIREGSAHLGDWRLSECILCVTLEPCTMCIGAVRLSRIPTIVIGASDSKQGACGSLFDLSVDERLGGTVRIIRDIKSNECSEMLRTFFASRRT